MSTCVLSVTLLLRTSREVGLAGRVVSVIAIFIVPAQQVVDGEVDVQVGPLEFPDDHTPGLPLKDYLGLGGGDLNRF